MAGVLVAVDAMGGDNAPGAIVEGVKLALAAYPDLCVRLHGQKAVLDGLIGERDRLTLCDAPDVIDIHEAPMLAVRHKPDSSLVRAMLDVREGRAQACVSAGSTGAILAGGLLRIGRIPGVERPALTVIMPGRNKPFLMLDCGANVDCQPAYLNMFGVMGSIFMQKVMRVNEPDVRLLNIGAEAEKGNRLAKEAYALMAAQDVYRFGGNIEARDVPNGDCDVVVADGFDGNLLIKYTEGLSSALIGMLKDEMLKTTRSKVGALLLKPALRAFKKRMSADEYGGAPLLGVQGAVIKAHGSAQPLTIQNAIRQACDMVRGQIVPLIAAGIEQVKSKEDGSHVSE